MWEVMARAIPVIGMDTITVAPDMWAFIPITEAITTMVITIMTAAIIMAPWRIRAHRIRAIILLLAPAMPPPGIAVVAAHPTVQPHRRAVAALAVAANG